MSGWSFGKSSTGGDGGSRRKGLVLVVLCAVPALQVHAIGNGLAFPVFSIAGLRGIKDREQGVASGLITASVQIGTGLGVAAVTAALATTAAQGGSATELVGYHHAVLAAALISAAGALAAGLGLGEHTRDRTTSTQIHNTRRA